MTAFIPAQGMINVEKPDMDNDFILYTTERVSPSCYCMSVG